MRRWLYALVLLAANTDGWAAAPASCELPLVDGGKDGPAIDNPTLAEIALDDKKAECEPQITKIGQTNYVTFKNAACLANKLLQPEGKATVKLVAKGKKTPAPIGQCKWAPGTAKERPNIALTLSAKPVATIDAGDDKVLFYWDGKEWKQRLAGDKGLRDMHNLLDGHEGQPVLVQIRGAVELAQAPAKEKLKAPAASSPGTATCTPPPVYSEQEVVHVINQGKGVITRYSTWEPVIAWCPTAPGADIVCVDVWCGSMNIVYVPPRNVLGQNRGLVVRVRHAPGVVIEANWAGKRGIASLGMAGTGKIVPQSGKVGSPPPPPTEPMVSSFPFPPRLPGQADLTIAVKRNGKVVKTQTLELEIEQLTWGAARFGFGALFGDAVAKGYKAQSFAGSSQLEIMQTNDAWLGWEAVLGFAPYLIDIFQCPGHGRSHTGGCNWYISPYVGIGVVGQAAAGVESFKSLYLGAEVEFAPSFSLAATAVWRSVDTLLPGYAVGSPVQPETQFSQSTTGFGFGLVVNVSPDFLQFGTKTDPKAPSPDPNPPQETDGGAADDEPVPSNGGAVGGAGGSGGTGGAAGHAVGGAGGAAGHAVGGAGGAAGHAAGGTGGAAGHAASGTGGAAGHAVGGAGGAAGHAAGGAGGAAGRAP